MKSNNIRLDWIDSIRGIASLLVVFQHLHLINFLKEKFENIGILYLLLDSLDLGKIGVLLFFFVSGFVIPFSFLKYKKNAILSFCVSRFFRLYPIYWLSILLAVFLVNVEASNIEVIFNFTMFQKFLGIRDLLGVYWTLQIELIFYFLCIYIFWKGLLDQKNLFIFAYMNIGLALILAILRFLLHMKLPVALPLSLAAMFLGTLMRIHLLKEANISRNKLILLFIIFMISMIPISFLAYNFNFGFDEKWYRYLVTYLVSPLLFIALTTNFKITNRFFLHLGQISYSIYLLHPIVISFPFLDSIKQISVWYQYIGVLVITIILSYITFYLLEQPSIQIGKKLINKLNRNNHFLNSGDSMDKKVKI